MEEIKNKKTVGFQHGGDREEQEEKDCRISAWRRSRTRIRLQDFSMEAIEKNKKKKTAGFQYGGDR